MAPQMIRTIKIYVKEKTHPLSTFVHIFENLENIFSIAINSLKI